ncbi:transcriptional regulator [Mycolicibacterium sp. CBMA 234]|uniref:transcriptional regulator n=1 Tax=Mycolicibacterium sp. CBMA 234 TaxID=1918495 RepID=UPI0035CCF483
MPNIDPDDVTEYIALPAVDPGMERAGAAAAARRRELDISQRSLAADGIINAGALISFEKGRSWPRERTRLRLEEVLQWPPGTIARIRSGEPVPMQGPMVPQRQPQAAPAPPFTSAGEVPLIAQAVVAAVNTLGATADALPAVEDSEFTPWVTQILSDLRQLEAVAASAARLGPVSPPLIKALGLVRARIDALTLLGAKASTATLGQRLYAARRGANLTIAETALAAGVPEAVVVGAEAEASVSDQDKQLVEALLLQLV